MSFIGCVDTVSDTCISGWAADNSDLAREVAVDIAVNGRVVATVCCASFREDLAAAGIGDGWKGFEYDPGAHFKAGRNSVEVHYAGTAIPVHRGQGQWVRARPLVSAAEGGFLAALEAYHEFSPRDHICCVGEGAAEIERALVTGGVPFRRYTALEAATDEAAMALPENADVLICAGACNFPPEWLGGLVEGRMNRPGLLAARCGESADPAGEMRRTLETSGAGAIRLESMPSWQGGTPRLFAFVDVGSGPPAAQAAPVLAHIHVPKCAGTSLRVLLQRHFGGRHLPLYVEDTYFVYGQESLRSYLLRDDPDLVGFSSHHVRIFPRWLAGREMLYITFLRDPIEQFVSYMTHIKKYYAGITSESLLRAVPPDAPRLPLREFARWLLTQDCDVPFRENHNVNFFTRHNAPGAADRLAAAKAALESFFFVGIAERMEESIRRLGSLAGAAGIDFPPGPAPSENTSFDYRDDLSWIHPGDEVGSLLLRSVAEDRQLYEWATARFAGAVEPSGLLS